MSIVITGASGHLGRRTAELVLDAGAAPVLVTRRPEALAGLAERGADVRYGDFDEPASLAAAFAGGERLLLISTDRVGERLAGHRAAIAAAAAAGVRQIAYTSLINPSDNNPAGVAPDHRETEEAIRAAGLAWTFLRNAIYAEIMAAGAGPALATGTLVTNAGDGRCSYVTREDCAAAAAAVLTSDGHEFKAYDISGPEALSVDDIAALYAEAGGRPVARGAARRRRVGRRDGRARGHAGAGRAAIRVVRALDAARLRGRAQHRGRGSDRAAAAAGPRGAQSCGAMSGAAWHGIAGASLRSACRWCFAAGAGVSASAEAPAAIAPAESAAATTPIAHRVARRGPRGGSGSSRSWSSTSSNCSIRGRLALSGSSREHLSPHSHRMPILSGMTARTRKIVVVLGASGLPRARRASRPGRTWSRRGRAPSRARSRRPPPSRAGRWCSASGPGTPCTR